MLLERVDLVLEAEAVTAVLLFEALGSVAGGVTGGAAGGAGEPFAAPPPGDGTCCVED